MNALDDRLRDAHLAGDLLLLVDLYREAADAAPDAEAAAFYLTHAHVFALETNHAAAPELRQCLIDQGREEGLPPPLPPFR